MCALSAENTKLGWQTKDYILQLNSSVCLCMLLQDKCLSKKFHKHIHIYNLASTYSIQDETKLLLVSFDTLQNQNNTVFLLEMRLKKNNNNQVRKVHWFYIQIDRHANSQFSYLLIWSSKVTFFCYLLLTIVTFPTM